MENAVPGENHNFHENMKTYKNEAYRPCKNLTNNDTKHVKNITIKTIKKRSSTNIIKMIKNDTNMAQK